MAHNKAPVKWVLLHAVGPCTAVPQQFKYLQSFLTVDHPRGQSLPVACQEQSRFNYNKTVYTSFTRVKLKCPAQMSRETEPLSSTGNLLNKAILPHPEDIANVPNT